MRDQRSRFDFLQRQHGGTPLLRAHIRSEPVRV
jgi:hypothetical protein